MDKITDLTCRVCLNVEELMVDIYEEVEDWNTDLSSLLEQCGDLKVERSDNYPKYLCKECTSELLIAAKFREKCSRSKEILQQYEAQLQEAPYLVDNNYLNSAGVEKCAEDEKSYLESSQQSASEAKENDMHEAENLLLPLDFVLHQGIDDVDVNVVDAINANEYQFNTNTTLGETETSIDEATVIVVGIEQEEAAFRNFDSEIIEYETNDQKLIESASKIITEGSAQHESQLEKKHPDVEVAQETFIPSDVIGNLRFTCDLCGAAFASAQNLTRHISVSHLPPQLFHCHHCRHCFSLEENFIKHSRVCNTAKPELAKDAINNVKRCGRRKKVAQPNENATCSYCNKMCTNTFALNMHLRTHTGERPFKCTECPKSFKTRSTLGSHMKRHGGVPDFVCPHCSKTFFESTNLQAHIRTHTGEKPHCCTVCDKRFTRVFLLQLHMRTHTGEKPYNCPHCTRSFAQLCDMKNHIRTHTGERQFQCQLCSKSFIKRSPFLWHMDRHAALKEVCEEAAALGQLNEQQNEPSEVCIIKEESQESSLTSMKFDLNDLILEEQEEFSEL